MPKEFPSPSQVLIPPRIHEGFRFRYVFYLIIVILLLLSLFSHTPMDVNLLTGGFAPMKAYQNWVGPAGAQTAWFLYLTLGLAIWPLMLLVVLAAVRPFFSPPVRRKGFLSALILTIFGMTLLFAMWPEKFVADTLFWSGTQSLGLGGVGCSEKALSGGVLGQFFAAPALPDENISAGVIRALIGEVGTAVVAGIVLALGLLLIFLSDWKSLVFEWLNAAPTEPPPRPVEPDAGGMSVSVIPPPPVASELRRNEGQSLWAPPSSAPRETDGVEVIENSESETQTRSSVPPPMFGRPKGSPVVPAAALQQDPVFEFSKRETINKIPEFEVPPAQHKSAPRVISEEVQPFVLPPITMLTKIEEKQQEVREEVERDKEIIIETLQSFGINAWISEVVIGPRVIRFEISIDSGIRVQKVEQLSQNIAMNLAADTIRILAPIPGKNTVGIEVPNSKPTAVFMRQLMETTAWLETKAEIPIVIGKDIGGQAYITDLAKMPHLLIAGATGAGKSVCMNTLIMSLLFRFTPDQLRLIMVDPKVVEMEMYSRLPHLITPVVNDSAKVPLALRWAVAEMERRYRVMAKAHVKNLLGYNTRPQTAEPVIDDAGKPIPETMPYLVVIVDELADVMMTESKSDVETAIARIAQKGRAAGIHLVIATQRPSVNIITGVIKANLPTRIAFRVGSLTDSRVILDRPGAEQLLGKGDMLFVAPGGINLERIQGAMAHDPDIQKVVQFVADQRDQRFLEAVLREDEKEEDKKGKKGRTQGYDNSFDDVDEDEPVISDSPDDGLNPILEKYLRPGDGSDVRQSLEILFRERQISTSYIQRRLGIGYNSAAKIVDLFEERGIVGPKKEGGAKRDILIFDELTQTDD